MESEVITLYQIGVDIVVPIISALIGGGLTLWGVRKTIEYEKNNEKENLKLAVRPWIFNVDPMEDYDYKSSKFFNLITQDFNFVDHMMFIIKNTDNGVAIIDRIETEQMTYLPSNGNILDKNMICTINVYIDAGETLKDWILYVKDVYGNEYPYQLEVDGKEVKLKTN